ncbi:selenium metabolism-associated LysR family transcriptional regulator [Peptococcaceae bacterium 1198_IL3148]
MGPYQLEIFKTVVEKKSFSAAAQALFISQPAVSMHIRSLEEHYKTKLFDRTNQQITLTETGRILYSYAVKVLTLLSQVEKEISSYTGQIEGPLDIGASFTVGEYVVPKVLGVFNKRNPGVKAALQVTNTEHIVKLVSRQKLDLGLVEHSVDARNLIVSPIMQDELLVVFSPEHPWAKRKMITIQELKDMPLVLREHGSGTRMIAEERLDEAGFDLAQLNIIMELGSTEAVKEAVEAGFGITIISRWAVQKELKLGTLLSAKIEDVNMLRSFYLIHHKDKFKPLVVEKFIDFLISYCREYSY